MTPAPQPAVMPSGIPYVCLIPDVVRILRIPRRTLEKLLSRHELPLVELERMGKIRRFTGRSVEAMLAGRHDAPRQRGRV